MSTIFLLVCFLSLNESTCQIRKNVFYFTLKTLLFSRKSNFRILHFQVLWRHEMPKHNTRNTFQWIPREVNSLLMALGRFMSYCKRKHFVKNFYKNCGLKTSSRPFSVCKELTTSSIGKWNFWNKLLILDM